MCMIEQLRDELHRAIEMDCKDEILNLSRALDKEILKYIKIKSGIYRRPEMIVAEIGLFNRRKEMNA